MSIAFLRICSNRPGPTSAPASPRPKQPTLSSERSPTGQGRRAFLDLLDQQLPNERGPEGEPSATDFLLVDLPPIAERFATSFDELMTPIPDRPDYRAVLSVGMLVPRVLVTGVLEADDTVTLISVRIDLEAEW